MPQPLHVLRLLQEVLVDVAAEDDLLLDRDGRIEIDLQVARALRAPGQLHAQLLARVRLEIGRVPPELVLLERLRVVQPHDQRGIDLVQEAR